MSQLKRFTIAGILFVLVTGSLAHFLYVWTGDNPVVGLFTPVNESVWEHMKLLFFPMLIYSFIMAAGIKGNRLCTAWSLLWGNLAGTLLIPVLYYAYTRILGKDIFILDINIFILSILAAFGLSYKLSSSCGLRGHKPFTLLPACLALILFICFMVFSLRPPALKIFEDPAKTGAPAAYQRFSTALNIPLKNAPESVIFLRNGICTKIIFTARPLP